MKNITTVILAAGRSTRFISNKSKLTHELAGHPIINHVFDSAKKVSGKNIMVQMILVLISIVLILEI